MRTSDEIIERIKSYRPDFNSEELIRKSYEFAKRKHEGQLRKSGEPYFTHPAEVAYILTELKMDVPTIVAGLLHDVVEDTDTTTEQIKEMFGNEIAFIVEGVTKLEKYKFSSKEEREAESFRKLLISLSNDIRVLIVKLADRLHNMRTLGVMREEKRRRIAYETLTIYAPLANRLGIYKLKNELEDLSLSYLEPKTYRELLGKTNEKKAKVAPYLKSVIETVREKLSENNIDADIQWRFKHIYGIYRKMLIKGIPFDEVYDIAGIRIITDTVANCYFTLGLIHDIWIPTPGRIKDYIAVPKPNMYQSLHTTVVGPKGQFVEFQIRTREMHQTAEMGIAAHWKYKEGGGKLTDEERKRFIWLRNLLDWVKDERNPNEFMQDLKDDLYNEDIYVFTPKGDLKTLPVGSTPIDFAYSIHTNIGNKCLSAKVNGKLVPLSSTLKSGDKVEIVTGNRQSPNRDWLKFVKTSKARSAVRNFLRKEENKRAESIGKELLEREIKRLSDKDHKSPDEKLVKKLTTDMGYASTSSMFVDIGYGKANAEAIARKLLGIPIETPRKKLKRKQNGPIGIKVDGMDNIAVRLATCCHPLPGDDVIGIVNSGKGIVVHKKNCTVARQIMEEAPNKVVNVNFEPSDAVYNTKVRVLSSDQPGMLANVSSRISDLKVNIYSVVTRTIADEALFDFTVQVKSRDELNKLINAIKSVKGVVSVKRVSREKPAKSK